VRERVVLAELEGRRYEVRLLEPEPPYRELARRRRERSASHGGAGADAVVSPMQGTVLSVSVAEGDAVGPGQLLCIVEAMKMENEVHATRDGVVSDLSVAAGEAVKSGQVICRIVADADGDGAGPA
jgi:acetyl-CoA/propionyl-CoA carboxylase biotin carboxyl carrier protein